MQIVKVADSGFGLPYILIKDSSVEMKVLCLSQICETRAKEIFVSEPETIKWINSINSDDLFIDVGANIGIYSIYTNLFRRAQVICIEPDLENYRALYLNRYLNGIDSERFEIYPFACGSRTEVSRLFISNPFQPGGSMNSVDRDLTSSLTPSTIARNYRVVFKTRLDDIPVPTAVRRVYIKIDVDGLEKDVLLGALMLLDAEPKLFSILIELDSSVKKHKESISLLQSFGFYFDPLQVSESNAYIRKSWPEFSNLANFIFFRRDD